MTAFEARLARARLTAAWRKARHERNSRLHLSPGGPLVSGEAAEESEYLWRLAELDVVELLAQQAAGAN